MNYNGWYGWYGLDDDGWSRHHIDIARDYMVKLKSETLEGGRHNIDLFEKADNHRFARSWVQGECEEYDKAREKGCCGFHDVGLNAEEGTIRVGWNYGH